VKLESTRHDRDRVARNAATRLFCRWSFDRAGPRSNILRPLLPTTPQPKYHPVAGGEHLLAMLYPSKSSLIVISTTRQRRRRRSNPHSSPRRIGALPTRGFLLWRLSDAGPGARDGTRPEGPASETLHNSGHTHRQTRSKLRSHDLSRRGAYQFA